MIRIWILINNIWVTLNVRVDKKDKYKAKKNINKNNIVISGLESNKLTNCVIKADNIEGFTISNLNFEINNIRNAILNGNSTYIYDNNQCIECNSINPFFHSTLSWMIYQ